MRHKNNLFGLPKPEMLGHIMQSLKGPVSHLMFCTELSYITIYSCINLAKRGHTIVAFHFSVNYFLSH